ncbi:MAG: hypothetical protein ACJZ72_06595 [Opitutales bacterium]
MQVFDMEEIRDPGTLQIKVLQDWHQGTMGSHRTPGRSWSASMWVTFGPGRSTVSPSAWSCLPTAKPRDFTSLVEVPLPDCKRMPGPNPTERELLEGGVGLVITVVQEPGTYGQRALSLAAEKRFAETLNPTGQNPILGLARHLDAGDHHRLRRKGSF